jgi:hypothetical protein
MKTVTGNGQLAFLTTAKIYAGIPELLPGARGARNLLTLASAEKSAC